MDTGVDPTLTDLLRAARSWIAEDPDPTTRDQLTDLVSRAERGDPAAGADLADRFSGPLTFGTAGLRGQMGAGPRRMNRSVVIRAAAGLVAHLHAGGAGPDDAVVIGYDARHDSDVFARDTAEVVAGAGLRALLMPRALPTPVLAFAVRDLHAVAGVMVTASHNPARDNGYKVYLGDGSLAASPVDGEIAARIAEVTDLAEIPRGAAIHEFVTEELVQRYLQTVVAVAGGGPRDLEVVYTPMHGVGGELAVQAMETAGFTPPALVEAQAAPDPDFPTLAFPNPEEPGALDLAIALAEERGADLVLANDPDADRCAAAIPGPQGWRTLRGDEVGALLGDALLRRGVTGTYATTIVSSSLLASMAAAHGQPSTVTLTGFKWLGRVAGLAYGYEEALGYCVDPTHVRDKDGISALLLLCAVAAQARSRGRTLQDLLDDIARAHGLHATDQLSLRTEHVDELEAMMTALRARPPATLGGLVVETVEDLSHATHGLPAAEGLRFTLAGDATVVVRPSGTEPKLKCYLEVVLPVTPDDGIDAERIAAVGRLDAIKGDLRALLAVGTA